MGDKENIRATTVLWIEMNISIINYLSKNAITPPLHDAIMVVAADL